MGFPHQYKNFLLNNMYVPNAQVSGYLDLKFYNLSPFCIFSIDFVDF